MSTHQRQTRGQSQQPPKQITGLVRILQALREEEFFGELSLTFQHGKIVHCKQVKTFKLPD